MPLKVIATKCQNAKMSNHTHQLLTKLNKVSRPKEDQGMQKDSEQTKPVSMSVLATTQPTPAA